MKKYLVALILVLAMAVPAFAQNTIVTGVGSPHDNTQLSNSNANANVNTNTNLNTFVPTNLNSNIQGQDQNQGQLQGQGQMQGQIGINDQKQKQGQNNDQVIAPEQKVIFKSPTQLMAPPSQFTPELNFGTGRMYDVTGKMPNFAIYGIKRYAGESILEVINVNANVKFKNYFKAVLSDAKDIADAKDFRSEAVRIMVYVAEAQKTWTTGGNLGGAGSGLATSGLAGGSGAGSIVPQWGGTKADDLFTIIYVKVATAKVSSIDPTWKKVEEKKVAPIATQPPAKKTVFGKEVSD